LRTNAENNTYKIRVFLEIQCGEVRVFGIAATVGEFKSHDHLCDEVLNTLKNRFVEELKKSKVMS
jgi:hypothetical protein